MPTKPLVPPSGSLPGSHYRITSGGIVETGGTYQARSPSGKVHDVQIKNTIPRATFAKKLFKVLPVVSTVIAVSELMEDLGLSLQDGQLSTVGSSIPDGANCDSTVCYLVAVAHFNGSVPGNPSASLTYDEACIKHVDWLRSNTDTYKDAYSPVVEGGYCTYRYPPNGTKRAEFFYGAGTVSRSTLETAAQPVTEDSFASAFDTAAPTLDPVKVNTVMAVASNVPQWEHPVTEELPSVSSGTGQTFDVLSSTTKTTTEADGTVKEQTTSERVVFNDNRVTYNTTVVNATNGVVDSTTTEVSTETPEAQPSGPIKIDETGTPQTIDLDPQGIADSVFAPLQALIADPSSFWPQLPAINWTFELPTGCSVLSVPAFDPWLSEIDICRFQPMFHDVMNVVWILGGLFGAIGLFWRNTLATV
jgi:hypothetical protein